MKPGYVSELSTALAEAMSLDGHARAMQATRAMAHVAQHFTNEQMASGTLDVYAELLGQGSLKALPSNDVFSSDDTLRART